MELHRYTVVVPAEITKELEKLKEATGSIDFGCSFDHNGKCNTSEEWASKNEMCCCKNCFNEQGYTNAAVTQEQLDFLKKNFLPNIGFWRKGTGCVIPRKWRSMTCLNYYCGEHTEEMQLASRSLGREFTKMSRKLYKGGYYEK